MRRLKQLLKNNYFLLSIIILFGLLIRIYNLKDNFIFAYDQARDAQRVWEIIYEKNLKIVGPETDIPGVFNGPLLYYLLLPIYYVFEFDPNFAAFFFSIINLSGVLILYLLSNILFKDKKIGIIAGFFWSISFIQLNFAKFISNASLMSISSGLFFLGNAYYFLKNKDYGIFLSVIGLALAIHSNFYLIYLALFYPLYFLIFKPQFKPILFLKAFFLFLLLISNFIVAELKWNFMATKSLLNFFFSQKERILIITHSISHFKMFFDRFTDAIYYSFFSFNLLFSFFIFIFLFLLSKKLTNKKNFWFYTLWLFSTLPLFIFRSGVLYGHVVNTTIFLPLTLTISAGLNYLLKNKKNKYLGYLIFIVFIISNFYLIKKDGFNNTKLPATKPIVLKDEYKVIDYTYNNKNKKFSICAVTEPLFINSLWSFLYKTYGEKKYKYLPYWSGPKQYLNKNFLPYDKNHVENRYLIIERQAGIPDVAINATLYAEDKISNLIEEKHFGNLTVQKRILLNPEEVKNKKINFDSNLESVLSNDYRYSCFNKY